MNTGETTVSAEGALAVTRSPTPAGGHQGTGRPRLSPTQLEARRKDREAIERLRRPAIAYSARELRFEQRLLRAKEQALAFLERILADEKAPAARRARIAIHLSKLKRSGTARDIADRTGIQKLKSVELRAMDDFLLPFENQKPTDDRMTGEQAQQMVEALVLMGLGRVEPIDVPWEESDERAKLNGPH